MEGVNATVQGVEWLSNVQREELAKDKTKRIFTWTCDDVDNDPLTLRRRKRFTADESKDLILAIRQEYQSLRQAHPDWTDDQCRDVICRIKYSFREFARDASDNFKFVTNSATTDELMQHQLYNLYVQKQVETGQLTLEQGKVVINEYHKKNAMKGKTKVNPNKKGKK